ncbi:hypothetical protein [Streptomyces sp. NPDC087859]|uniref:hypothetical protein n=1 Tax=Streptomyces sp. NPDC087859 TaxID=3365812 RepID=UPI0038144060
MTRPLVTARQITVGRDAPELVPEERDDFYQWLGKILMGQTALTRPAGDTVYITSEELNDDSFRVEEYLGRTLPKGRAPQLLIIDLAANPYGQLRESLVIGVASTVQRWLAQVANRSLAILLPELPHEGSELWRTLRTSAGSRVREAKLVVISNDGTTKWLHGDSSCFRQDFESVYVLKQDPPPRDPGEQLSRQIVRRLGHYASRGRADPHCNRYFFDAEHAAPEIGELAERWLRGTVLADREVSSDLMLLSKDRQTGLDEAIAGIASGLGLECGTFDAEGRIFDAGGALLDASRIHKTVVLFFAVVSKREKFEKIIRALRRDKIQLAQRAWTVLATDVDAKFVDSALPLDAEQTLSRKAFRHQECEQCSIGLPHTDPSREHHALRTYDAWDILLTSRWGEEEVFPTADGLFFPFVPDMGDVFDKYGDCIASKVINLLRALGPAPSSVVLVCPDEDHINKLVDRISTLMKGRPVKIAIPGEALDHSTSSGGARARARRRRAPGSDVWRRQLRPLRGRKSKVVILDEFRATGLTARAMHSLLLSENVHPVAYIPILDFSGETDLDGLPVHSLYRIRATRSGA